MQESSAYGMAQRILPNLSLFLPLLAMMRMMPSISATSIEERSDVTVSTATAPPKHRHDDAEQIGSNHTDLAETLVNFKPLRYLSPLSKRTHARKDIEPAENGYHLGGDVVSC